jgi:predicted dehydrogenase
MILQTRRSFLQSAAVLGCGVWAGGAPFLKASGSSANEKLNVAVVGVAGRGRGNMNAVARTENIVALCDVDAQRLAQAAESFPKAKQYADYRQMLEQPDIDAVLVNTPDHTHAAISVAFMELGKHVYCEKPLTHTVEEARVIREAARKAKVVTQMGTQMHATDNYRRVLELIRTGAIGAVQECHIWLGGGGGTSVRAVSNFFASRSTLLP